MFAFVSHAGGCIEYQLYYSDKAVDDPIQLSDEFNSSGEDVTAPRLPRVYVERWILGEGGNMVKDEVYGRKMYSTVLHAMVAIANDLD